MSTSLNSKALYMKLVITQQTITPCSNSCKDYHRVLVRKSLKIPQLKPTIKWRKRQLVLQHCSISSMHCIDNHRGMLLKSPTFKLHGKQGDNASRTIKTHSHKGKDSDKPHSAPLLPQSHGTTSQSQWTSIEQETWEGTGEDKGGEHPEETLQGQMTQEHRGEYRVHVSTVVNKGTSLTIVPQNRNTPIHKWHSS